MLVFIVLYQQIENYLFAPRITARTMELHAAVAFGAALAGAAVLGPVGAVLALPASAMVQALASGIGPRYRVVDSHLTAVLPPSEQRDRFRRQRMLQRRRAREARPGRSRPGCAGSEAGHVSRPVRSSRSRSPTATATTSPSTSVRSSRSARPARSSTPAGDPPVAVYPRSSNKPMQAVAMVRAGLVLLATAAGARVRQPRRHPAARRRWCARSSPPPGWPRTTSATRRISRSTTPHASSWSEPASRRVRSR